MTDVFVAKSAKPMLIGLSGAPFDSPDYVFELKLDGERCLAYLDGRETVLVNRRDRRLLPQFPEMKTLHRNVGRRCILDGELVAGVGGKADFEYIKRRALVRRPHAVASLSREHPATFVAVDILFLDKELITHLPLWRRQETLAGLVREDERLALSRVVAEKGVRFYDKVKAMGLEGIIGKRRDSVYRMGKRTRDWVKIKNWLEDDFVVCGYLRNRGAAVASVILGQHGGDGRMVYKGRVTLGMAREDFKTVLAVPKTSGHPFVVEPPPGNAGAVWIRPRLVCRVGFMCHTAEARLRQPFYKGLRPGVRADDVRESPDAANECQLVDAARP